MFADENLKKMQGKGQIKEIFRGVRNINYEIHVGGKSETWVKCIIVSGGWTPLAMPVTIDYNSYQEQVGLNLCGREQQP